MSEDTLAAGAAAAENPAPGATTEQTRTDAPLPDTKATPATDATSKKDAPAADAKPAGPWGDDWREKLAGDDPKRLERLKRLASPEAMLQSLEEGQRKISEGLKPRAKPGDKATEEEWAAYRKDAGIPDKVEDYVKAIALPDDRQIGEIDKPVVEAFAERAIKSGVAPSDMAVLIDEYYRQQEDVQNQQSKQDSDYRKEAERELREAWGGDYDGNIAAMRPYFETVDSDLFNNLMGGRMADGRKIGNHPAIVKFFAAKAVAENPLASVLPQQNSGAVAIDNEIAALEKRMGEDRGAWFKDSKAQARLQALYAARDKVAAK